MYQNSNEIQTVGFQMEEISQYNCEGLCLEKTCGSKYTHFVQVNINGLNILIPLCEKHAEEFKVYPFDKDLKLKILNKEDQNEN